VTVDWVSAVDRWGSNLWPLRSFPHAQCPLWCEFMMHHVILTRWVCGKRMFSPANFWHVNWVLQLWTLAMQLQSGQRSWGLTKTTSAGAPWQCTKSSATKQGRTNILEHPTKVQGQNWTTHEWSQEACHAFWEIQFMCWTLWNPILWLNSIFGLPRWRNHMCHHMAQSQQCSQNICNDKMSCLPTKELLFWWNQHPIHNLLSTLTTKSAAPADKMPDPPPIFQTWWDFESSWLPFSSWNASSAMAGDFRWRYVVVSCWKQTQLFSTGTEPGQRRWDCHSNGFVGPDWILLRRSCIRWRDRDLLPATTYTTYYSEVFGCTPVVQSLN